MERDDDFGRDRDQRAHEKNLLQRNMCRAAEKPALADHGLRDAGMPRMDDVERLKEERKAQAQVEVELIRGVEGVDAEKWSKLDRAERREVLQKIENRLAPFQARDPAWVVWTNERKWKHEWSDRSSPGSVGAVLGLVQLVNR